MATIDELRARRDAAAAAADAERTTPEDRAEIAERAGESMAAGFARGVEPEYRLLTDEQAMRAALGDATGQAAAEIAEAQRAAIAETDRNYADNARA